MLAFIIRGVFLVSILSWYSAIIWKVIDDYFQDQFRTYLQEEYRKHPRIKAESAEAVDKGPAPSALPVEPSFSHGTAETYGSNAVCPADIADACPRTSVPSGKPEETVAGGTSEIAVAVGAGTTDKDPLLASPAVRSAQESRRPPSGSDTRDEEQRPGAINQDGDREEDTIEGSVLPYPAPSARRAEKPRGRLDEKRLLRASKEASREISRKRPKNRRMNTLVLTDADFAAARTGEGADDDFSEFEEEEEEKDQRTREGILVSELPFRPKADIGGLDRVTAEEFCPLTLEDETSCGETTTWP